MKRSIISRPEIKCIGIQVSTSYEKELDKMKGNIFPCVQKYFHQSLFENIPHRTHPGTTICAYSDYESDYQGAYTYFIGEEVDSYDSPIPEGMIKFIIPKQRYIKFTTSPIQCLTLLKMHGMKFGTCHFMRWAAKEPTKQTLRFMMREPQTTKILF